MYTLAKPGLALLLALLSLISQQCSAQTELFHGYSVGIQPSSSSSNPANATFQSSNFYSYGTPTGYISFGWFLRAAAKTNTAKCQPDSDDYQWFEYANGKCGYRECTVYAKNYKNTPYVDTPNYEGNYVSRFLDIGDSLAGKLAVSYFDQEGGNFGVGSRDLLSGSNITATRKECNKAFKTLKRLQAKRKLAINFELVNPC